MEQHAGIANSWAISREEQATGTHAGPARPRAEPAWRSLGLRARPWFEYVRSKANPADEPSRVDLAGVRWRVLACPELVSEPVPVSWPQADDWRDPAGWARLAAGRAAAASGW